ncbi:MAG TPA: phytanoyl-CoA dioxygenase family protein [Vicinamibacteria bacterium]|nr:phytanoyl-CoA dioxygenase family protein [Vicinamibacteria bacterium]
MRLEEAEGRSLLERGYAVVPGGAAPERIDAALKAINVSLGRGLHASELEQFRSQSFCPELRTTAAITGLFHGTAARPLAEALLGALEPVTIGQIALVFPSDEPGGRLHPHLDGLHTPTNGVPEGTVRTFTLLVGVLLSDQTAPGMGNLVVWPGSHRLYEEHFRRHGGESLLEGLPDVPLPPPEPVLGRAGDLVLCHYQLAHTGGANTSPRVRYSVYFRVKAAGHDARRWECLMQLWREWPGLAPVSEA